ncbi:SCC1 / RAD21 FAMILY MEMBER [Salix koriyanagi]|uniref:SCC1 / RAD21 FAMILY MEMBER n=1 Tax=Salix koriyanagi TaxID=2511006 RepID=A0A9Q0P5V1_9ROSI|nr:SCC1 / RAD21 FAMILY MEMBER [Salix koriyanagi]
MEDKEEEELLNLSLTIVTDSNGADMNMKRKRSREDHVLNPLMNSYEGCSEGKIYRLLRMREQMIKLDDKKKAVVEDFGKRLHLIHLLRITSTEADESNVGSALENLKELYQSVSLIGANTPEFRVISTPAAKEHARVLRKRKCLFDDVVVFPNNVLKQCIEDTGDLVSKRRKLPHIAFAIWKACRFSNLDKCFLESTIPCTSLWELGSLFSHKEITNSRNRSRVLVDRLKAVEPSINSDASESQNIGGSVETTERLEELNVSGSPLVGRLDETVEPEENMLIQESAEIMEYPQKFVSECPSSARFVETVEPLDMSEFCTVGRSVETAETLEKSNVFGSPSASRFAETLERPGKLDIAESPTAGGCLEQLAIAPETPIRVHNIR